MLRPVAIKVLVRCWRCLQSVSAFNLRIPPELHERPSIKAQAEGKNINTLAAEALALRVAGSEAARRQPFWAPYQVGRQQTRDVR